MGGLEEIGRNSMFFEYRDEIVIVDLGLQFPEEATPGIDFIIPNTAYLEEKKNKIKALILTHAHYDHIGGIPYLMQKIGNPPIYTTQLTKEIVNRRQEDVPNAPQLIFEIVKAGDKKQIGEHFSAEFFDVVHTIPDTIGVVLTTPAGKIMHPGEYKLDKNTLGESRTLDIFKKLARQKIDFLLQDSTGAEKPGESISEELVRQNLEDIFKTTKGRIIVATFASLLDRLYEVIKIAERMKKFVAISGYSMKTNIQICQNLKYIRIKSGTLINIEDISQYKDDKVLILCTGAQGEPNASLMRIANREHRFVKVVPGDTIILSSSIVPGNERSVQTLKDNLARQGARIFTYAHMDIHSSGHAPQEDIKQAIKALKPRFYLPIHGYYFMRSANADLAEEVGIKRENIIMVDNGQVVEFVKESAKVTGETVPTFYVMVDGLGVGDVGEVVLRDRRTLAEEGMIVIIASISRQTGRVIKNPDIISRGFIYLKENKELLDEIRRKIRGILGRIPHYRDTDPDYIKTLIKDQIAEFLYKKTQRRPMVLPVIIEI